MRSDASRVLRAVDAPSVEDALTGTRTRHGPTVHARGTGVSKDNGARSGAQRGGVDLMVIAVATRLS